MAVRKWHGFILDSNNGVTGQNLSADRQLFVFALNSAWPFLERALPAERR
jgi:hypothetical protein